MRGKWHGHHYHVIKKLGSGSVGTVYKVHDGQHSFALKVGHDAMSLMSEVNVLKQCDQVRGVILGPSVYDVDDWQTSTATYPFYVMNVIEGHQLQTYIHQKGEEWMAVFVVQLLRFLDKLHEQGWVFGDLKPDNLLIKGSPPCVAWLDPGGMTKIGRAVKEYTERFDRGYWQMGDRKAEPSYDLFSLAMIVLDVYQLLPNKNMTTANHQQLQTIVYRNDCLAPYQTILWNALNGHYRSAKQMKNEWMLAWQQQRQPYVPQSLPKKKGKLSVLFLFSFLLFLFALLLFLQVF